MITWIFHQVFSLVFVVGVLGNLVAAIVWAAPALWHLHRKLDRHHRESMSRYRDS